MSDVLWLNIPLMVIAFGLISGVPLWLVLRRPGWHDKPEATVIPTYLVVRSANWARASLVRTVKTARRDVSLTARPLHGAEG